MDLFGGMSVEETPLLVLQSQSRMSKKDQLDWEKELLGLYISDHPLNAYLRQVEGKISHNSNALIEAEENEKVTVGGVVNRLRPIRTKKDQMMAFVTLSDTFGDMDLVFFPKTWEQTQQVVDVGKALLVEGKAQHRDGKVTILVDKATLIETGNEQSESGDSMSGPFFELAMERNLPDMRLLSRYAWPPAQLEKEPEQEQPVEEPDDIYSESPPWENEPEFMDDPFFEVQLVDHMIVEETITIELDVPSFAESEVEVQKADPVILSEGKEPEVERSGEEIDYEDEDLAKHLPKQMLVVTLQPCDSPEKDQRRLSRYYGWLCSHPGQDVFGFRLMGPHGWRVVYFPNFPIEINDGMLAQLEQDLGKENVICQAYTANLSF